MGLSLRFLATLLTGLAVVGATQTAWSAAGDSAKGAANIFFVDVSNNTGTQDGLSWETAFTTIQRALDTAAPGDQVWVARGTYAEDRSTNEGSLQLRDSIELYGGFVGNEAVVDDRDPVANVTIIDGAASAGGSAPAPHVVVGADGAILDGFTIRGGQGPNGAGMLIDGTSTSISDCIFTANNTLGLGGAVLNRNGASPTFTNCVFTQNTADTDGGAVATIDSEATLLNCTITNNEATGDAGGVYNGPGSSVVISGGLVQDNVAADQGGGVYNAEGSRARILRVRILGNSVNNRGAGISNATTSDVVIAGCLIARNVALIHGGGINSTNVSPTILSTTVTANTAEFRGAGIYNNGDDIASQPIVSGLIVWGNFGEPVGNNGTARLIANYSNIEGGIGGGEGNINLDPLFAGPSINNFRLREGSPCIDTGQATVPLFPDGQALDFEDDDRGFDGDGLGLGGDIGDGSDYDMGFDEFTGPENVGQITEGEQEGTVEGVPEGEGTSEGAIEGTEEGSTDGEGTVEGSEEGVTDGEGTAEGNVEGTEEGAIDGEGATEGEGNQEGEGVEEGEAEGAEEGAAEGSPEGITEGELEFGDVVFVDINNDSGVEDGRTWATAVREIHTGILVARFEEISEIWVAAGTYDEVRPGTGALVLREGVSIYGGFSGTETQRTQRDFRTNQTIVDGSNADAGQPASNVVEGADNARLDGFTIQGGRGFAGAGLLNFSVSPVIANCTFQDNDATDFGGAVFNLDGASPLFTNCVFDNNTAGESGGAIVSLDSAPSVVNSVFTNNVSRFGGAVFNNTAAGDFIACTFAFNEATQSAGALAVLQSSPAIIGCTFSSNISADAAGALFMNVGSARVEDCRFFANRTGTSGGAIYTLGPPTDDEGLTIPFIVNSVFSENEAAELGGAMFNNTSRPTIVNCTFNGNIAPNGGGDITTYQSQTRITNSILWNSADALRDLLGESDVTYSIVQGGHPGTGNLDTDPLFLNAGFRNFRIPFDSPAVDAGRSASSSALGNVIDDIEGTPRGFDGTSEIRGDGSDYDIGAYEFSTAPTEGEQEGDIDGEGSADCTLENVEAISPAADSTVFAGNGVSPLPLGFSASTDCITDTSFVRYRVDGEPVGGAFNPPYAFTMPDVTLLAAGRHDLTVEAFDAIGSQLPVQSESSFNLLAAPAGADANGNGLPDQATTVLKQDGDIWSARVQNPTDGTERVTRVDRFDRAPGNLNNPVVSVTSHPALPGVLVSIEIERRVLTNEGDIGLLVVAISTTLESLLGRDEAVQLTPVPDAGQTPGAPYVAAGILVSSDNGATFSALSPDRLAQFPATVTITGIEFETDNTEVVTHPLRVRSSGADGLQIEAIFNGGWTDDAVISLDVEADRLRTLLTALDLFSPFKLRPTVTTLQVSPAQHTFGRVALGGSTQQTFVVRNTGEARVTGRARATLPFRIASGASYTVEPGATHNVVVSFSPDEARDYTSRVTFSGGPGVERIVTGTGIVETKQGWFGCNAGSSSLAATSWADIFMMATVVIILLGAARKSARQP